jgi:transcription initiation factor TFIIB
MLSLICIINNMSTRTFNLSDINISNINIYDLNKYFPDCQDGIDFNNDNKVNSNKGNINKITECFNCNDTDIIEDYTQGNMVCKNCGQVLDGVIDFNPEWKQFDDDDKANARCGMPINIHLPQSSLGTTFAGGGRNRIKILHGWNSMPYNERSLNNEFKKIKDVCLKGNILKCVEDDAIIMYRLANESKIINNKKTRAVITRGINRISISAACVFFACSRNEVIRTSKEIANLYNISDTEMNRGCKNLLKLLKNKNVHMKMGTSKPENFIKRYCDKLKIKNIFAIEAIKIAKNVEKLNIASGHTPYSTAAASILLMSDIYNLKTITKKKLAKEFNISDVTITKTYKEIQPYNKVLINDTKTNEIVITIKSEMDKESLPPEILKRMQKFGVVNIVDKLDDVVDIVDNESDEDNEFNYLYNDEHDDNNFDILIKSMKYSNIKKNINTMNEIVYILKNINEELINKYNKVKFIK